VGPASAGPVCGPKGREVATKTIFLRIHENAEHTDWDEHRTRPTPRPNGGATGKREEGISEIRSRVFVRLNGFWRVFVFLAWRVFVFSRQRQIDNHPLPGQNFPRKKKKNKNKGKNKKKKKKK